jgi:hypothetical protein
LLETKAAASREIFPLGGLLAFQPPHLFFSFPSHNHCKADAGNYQADLGEKKRKPEKRTGPPQPEASG